MSRGFMLGGFSDFALCNMNFDTSYLWKNCFSLSAACAAFVDSLVVLRARANGEMLWWKVAISPHVVMLLFSCISVVRCSHSRVPTCGPKMEYTNGTWAVTVCDVGSVFCFNMLDGSRPCLHIDKMSTCGWGQYFCKLPTFGTSCVKGSIIYFWSIADGASRNMGGAPTVSLIARCHSALRTLCQKGSLSFFSHQRLIIRQYVSYLTCWVKGNPSPPSARRGHMSR